MRFRMFSLLLLLLALTYSSGCCLMNRREQAECYAPVQCQPGCPAPCSP
jgi:hypothetical protein